MAIIDRIKEAYQRRQQARQNAAQQQQRQQGGEPQQAPSQASANQPQFLVNVAANWFLLADLVGELLESYS